MIVAHDSIGSGLVNCNCAVDVLVHKGNELPMLDSMCDVENQDYTCAEKM